MKSDKESNCVNTIWWNELTVNPDDKDLGLGVLWEPDQTLPQGSISCQASSSTTTETIRYSSPGSLMKVGEERLVKLLEHLTTFEEG